MKWATPQDWAFHQETITKLYYDEDMRLKDVIRIMEEEHGFYAT